MEQAMPFVQRDASGAITAIFTAPTGREQEELAPDHPELQAFLNQFADPTADPRVQEAQFNRLDADFIRVLEDLIDVLIGRGILRLTDLPVYAQEKMLSRQRHRAALKTSKGLDILSDDDTI
jgi:hypothetical protein